MSASRSRLRILYLHADLDVGGSETQLAALARRLPRDRFAPAFALLWEPGIHAAAVVADGIPVHLLGLRHPARDGWLAFAWSAVRALVRYLRLARRGRVDIVDAWLYQGYWLAALTRPLTRIPVFIAGRRSLSGFKRRWGPIPRALDAIARRAPDRIVANAEAVRASVMAVEGVAADRISVIRNGIVVDGIAGASRDAIRAEWGCGPDDVVVGCVALLNPRKGLEDLVAAMARVAERRPSVRTVLVGDGPLRSALEAHAAQLGIGDRVRFHGRHAEPRALHAGFDVFVHPSLAEGLPNAVLEAAASGLPIVATDVGGTREVVVHGRTGLLVPPGSPAALAEAVNELLADPERAGHLGEAAREHAAEWFGMDRFVAETGRLYEELAAAAGISRPG